MPRNRKIGFIMVLLATSLHSSALASSAGDSRYWSKTDGLPISTVQGVWTETDGASPTRLQIIGVSVGAGSSFGASWKGDWTPTSAKAKFKMSYEITSVIGPDSGGSVIMSLRYRRAGGPWTDWLRDSTFLKAGDISVAGGQTFSVGAKGSRQFQWRLTGALLSGAGLVSTFDIQQ